MSRDIKFRAWDKRSNCWEDFNDLKISKNGVVFDKDYDWEEEVWYDKADEEHNFVIEQYTGLKDKNGKEIYDGDIVNVIGTGIAQVIDSPTGEWMLYYRPESDEINSSFASVVPKNKPSGLWKTNTTSYIEVIGNIHENKELLGGEE